MITTFTTNLLSAIDNDHLPKMLLNVQLHDKSVALSEFGKTDDEIQSKTQSRNKNSCKPDPFYDEDKEETSAFVKVMLSTKQGPKFEMNGGFLTSSKSGQV